MKVELCSFSGKKIYPGKGRLYVRSDNRAFRFVSSKSELLFLQRKNPRKISWTVLSRRMHRKGISEETAKKRSRRTIKHQRAIVGASLDAIAARRNQKPEVRAAAQAQALVKSKEDKKKRQEERKAAKAKGAVAHAGAGAKISKQGAKGGAQRVRI